MTAEAILTRLQTQVQNTVLETRRGLALLQSGKFFCGVKIGNQQALSGEESKGVASAHMDR
jgi:hypothetical protein